MSGRRHTARSAAARAALVVALLASTALVARTAPDVTAAPESLVVNPSVESSASGDTSRPTGWNRGRWGTNTATFSYRTGDAHTGYRYTRVTMSNRTSGDAKWWHDHVPVAPNTTYTFTNWYRATTTSALTAEFRDAKGNRTYRWLASLSPATSWTPNTATFTTPVNATSVTVYHLITTTGRLDTDDTTITTAATPPPPATTTPPTSAPATSTPAGGDTRRVVHLTFDDGPSPYTLALLEVLQAHGVKATFFMVGQEIRRYPEVVHAVHQRGHAIGNHTENHRDLTSGSTDARAQLASTSAAILDATGRAPACARPPMGRTNDEVDAIARALGMTMFNSASPNLDGGDYTTPQVPVAAMMLVLDRIPSTPDPVITTFHDGGGDRANTVKAFDQWLDANGSLYRFETLPVCR